MADNGLPAAIAKLEKTQQNLSYPRSDVRRIRERTKSSTQKKDNYEHANEQITLLLFLSRAEFARQPHPNGY